MMTIDNDNVNIVYTIDKTRLIWFDYTLFGWEWEGNEKEIEK